MYKRQAVDDVDALVRNLRDEVVLGGTRHVGNVADVYKRQEERLVVSVFHPVAERSYIRHGNIHVGRIERAVEQGSLSALADAGRNPFAGIDAFKGVADLSLIHI